MKTKQFDELITDLLDLCIDVEVNNPFVLTCKAQEELGEFAEAILYENGYLRHKKMECETFGEIFDVFMVMVAAAVKTYPDMSRDALRALLIIEFERKIKKYKEVIHGDD